MSVLENIILEAAEKTWYACISSKIWGSIWGSSVTSGGIPWGIINRQTSAVASPCLKESVIRWIKHNNFIKHVHIDGNTITVDGDWWSKEKNTEVIILKAPEGSTFKGVFSDRNIGSPYIQHGGLVMGGGNPFMSKKMKDEFAKETGIKSSTMTIESAIKKAGLKIKTDDTGVDITGPVNAFKKFNGWESGEMYTEDEVKEMLEKAFQEGYDNGIDDTLDYIEENYEIEFDESAKDDFEDVDLFEEHATEEDFDLEDEYDSYNEDVMSNLKKKLNNVPGKRNFDGLVNKGKSRAYQLAKIGRTLGNKATKQAKDTRGYISSRAKLLKRKINK